MITIRIENRIVSSVINIQSKIRSFLLFGRFNRVKFGRMVRLSGRLTFGRNIKIQDYSDLRGRNVFIHDNVYIHENVLIRSNEQIIIGEGTTINRNCCILAKVKIGRKCSIAPNVVIIGSNHIYSDPNKTIKDQGFRKKEITIEDDVWIAANSTILDGITIGKGAIIAAGALVNKDISPYSVVGGVPAKTIKMRI